MVRFKTDRWQQRLVHKSRIVEFDLSPPTLYRSFGIHSPLKPVELHPSTCPAMLSDDARPPTIPTRPHDLRSSVYPVPRLVAVIRNEPPRRTVQRQVYLASLHDIVDMTVPIWDLGIHEAAHHTFIRNVDELGMRRVPMYLGAYTQGKPRTSPVYPPKF